MFIEENVVPKLKSLTSHYYYKNFFWVVIVISGSPHLGEEDGNEFPKSLLWTKFWGGCM